MSAQQMQRSPAAGLLETISALVRILSYAPATMAGAALAALSMQLSNGQSACQLACNIPDESITVTHP